MPSYDDALRGYGFPIHKRDRFRCVYCGLDGTLAFAAWLCLSVDHLLPQGHPQRDDPEYIVTSCMFCNVADNQYFVQADNRGVTFEGKTQDELVTQRRPYVLRTRESYREFWDRNVQSSELGVSAISEGRTKGGTREGRLNTAEF
jgi:hypothetical protein